MLLPFTLVLRLVAQIPFWIRSRPHIPASGTLMETKTAFAFKEAVDVFSPKDLVELARPGTGVANDAGDLVLVPISKYSIEHKKSEHLGLISCR
jgi:hypothetical protein